MPSEFQSGIKYSWEKPSDPTTFQILFQSVERTPGSWRQEAYVAAHRIANTASKHIWLAISGGTDSEIMAHAFFDQGIHFSAITIAHSGGTNRAEVERAKHWCFKHGVPHEIVPMDAPAFLKHGVDAYIAAGYVANQTYRYTQLRLLELIEERRGFGVLGYGRITFNVRDTEHGIEPFMPINTSYATPFEWCVRHTANHQPYFFFSTPELLLAYFRMPFVRAALENPTAFRNYANNQALRRFLYQTEWPEIQSRIPYLGYERLAALRDQANARMQEAFASRLHVQRIPAAAIVRALS